jgi:hypothetical protein
MHTYTVLVREVHISHILTMADSPETAIENVKEGEGECVLTEYSHTLGDHTWSVDDENGNCVRDQE